MIMVLPKIVDTGAIDAVEAMGFGITASGSGMLVLVFFVTIFSGYSMNSILSEVRSLSMITHFNIMQLNYSPLITAFYGAIFPFINFDLFNVDGKLDDFYALIFPRLNDKAFSPEAKEIGYETLWISLNMGSQTMLIFLSAFSFVFFFLLSKCTNGRVQRFATNRNQRFKWAGMTNLVNEVYLNMSFAAIMNTTALSMKNWDLCFQSVFTVLMDIVLVVWPVFVTIRVA